MDYSECKTTLSFGYIIEKGKGKWKRKGKVRWQLVCLSTYTITENIFAKISGILIQ
jgi:hypothetical protein